MKVHPKHYPELTQHLLPMLGRLGRVGDRLIHWLGWVTYRNDTVTRRHAPDCPGADVITILKPQGYVKRCRACQRPITMHYACWERDDGMMPPEVVLWIFDELRAIPRDPDAPMGTPRGEEDRLDGFPEAAGPSP